MADEEPKKIQRESSDDDDIQQEPGARDGEGGVRDDGTSPTAETLNTTTHPPRKGDDPKGANPEMKSGLKFETKALVNHVPGAGAGQAAGSGDVVRRRRLQSEVDLSDVDDQVDQVVNQMQQVLKNSRGHEGIMQGREKQVIKEEVPESTIDRRMEIPGIDYDPKDIVAHMYKKAAENPRGPNDVPEKYGEVYLYAKNDLETDLEFFLILFLKYGNLSDILLSCDEDIRDIVIRKAAAYGITD